MDFSRPGRLGLLLIELSKLVDQGLPVLAIKTLGRFLQGQVGLFGFLVGLFEIRSGGSPE